MAHRRALGLVALMVAAVALVACDPPPPHLTQAQVDALPETPDACFVYHGPDVFEGCDGTVGLKMDVYNHPPPGVVWPVIVYVHGGGWFMGDRASIDDEPFHIGAAILQQANRTDVDWTVVSIDYSLDEPWPAPLLDVKRAVRMVQGLIGSTQEPVIVAGSSAGGHLATMAALTEGVSGLEPGAGTTEIAGAVNLDGPNDLDTLWNPGRDLTFINPTPAGHGGVFGTSVEFGELLARLAGCPTPYSDEPRPWDDPECEDSIDSLVDNASPVDRVDLDSPAVYLACGETVGFPLDFGCQTDHEAMHDVLVAEASPPVAALDDTRDDNGTHYSIDWHLDLPALQSFLDGLR